MRALTFYSLSIIKTFNTHSFIYIGEHMYTRQRGIVFQVCILDISEIIGTTHVYPIENMYILYCCLLFFDITQIYYFPEIQVFPYQNLGKLKGSGADTILQCIFLRQCMMGVSLPRVLELPAYQAPRKQGWWQHALLVLYQMVQKPFLEEICFVPQRMPDRATKLYKQPTFPFFFLSLLSSGREVIGSRVWEIKVSRPLEGEQGFRLRRIWPAFH